MHMHKVHAIYSNTHTYPYTSTYTKTYTSTKT